MREFLCFCVQERGVVDSPLNDEVYENYKQRVGVWSLWDKEIPPTRQLPICPIFFEKKTNQHVYNIILLSGHIVILSKGAYVRPPDTIIIRTVCTHPQRNIIIMHAYCC